MGPRLGRVEYDPWDQWCAGDSGHASMGPRLGRVEYLRDLMELAEFNVASMGPRLGRVEYRPGYTAGQIAQRASMGPRLGRVEYNRVVLKWESLEIGFNGATLRTRGIRELCKVFDRELLLLQWGHA